MPAITIRLSEEHMAAIQRAAQQEHRSVNGQIRHWLEIGQDTEEGKRK